MKKKETTARQTNVILEDIDKKFKFVLEGHDAIRKEIRDFRHEVRADITLLKISDSVTTENVKDMKARMGRIEDKYDKNFKVIMEYLKRIDDEIQELKPRFAGKADLERLMQLEARVGQVELVVKKYYGKNKS